MRQMRDGEDLIKAWFIDKEFQGGIGWGEQRRIRHFAWSRHTEQTWQPSFSTHPTRTNEVQSAHPRSDPWKNSGWRSFLMRTEVEEESPFNLAPS